jgi:tetratricopeptide (TPR) repeat protein
LLAPNLSNHYQTGTNREFFDQLKMAVALSNKVYEGERLNILGLEAGAYRDPIKQRELYQRLVTLFPSDERALTPLSINYFVQQDYSKAAEYLKRATVIALAFAPAYNQLGYSYLFQDQFAEAENAFKKYAELIPNDPNPYDSYAELLLKAGRFNEAITQYRKALSLDPQFTGSFNGIAAALMFAGNHDEALAEIQKAYDTARNEGEQRTALFTKTIIYVDQRKFALAYQAMGNKEKAKQYFAQPAKFNGLPSLNYAFIRTKVEKMLARA